MKEAFHLGGWGMYPTAVFALVMIAFAIQFARDPERRKRAVVRSLGALVALSGVFGFVTGAIKTFEAAGADPIAPFNVALIGIGEAAHNLGLALCSLVLARIFVTIGTLRDTTGRADLADPHTV